MKSLITYKVQTYYIYEVKNIELTARLILEQNMISNIRTRRVIARRSLTECGERLDPDLHLRHMALEPRLLYGLFCREFILSLHVFFYQTTYAKQIASDLEQGSLLARPVFQKLQTACRIVRGVKY
jgi:hypothetical protein